MIVDTTVLAHSLGPDDHPLTAPCREVLRRIGEGRLRGTTTAEVIQEFVYVRARRVTRSDAVAFGRRFARALGPLHSCTAADLDAGLDLFERYPRIGGFDAVLAAIAIRRRLPLVSTDGAFSSVEELDWIHPLPDRAQ